MYEMEGPRPHHVAMPADCSAASLRSTHKLREPAQSSGFPVLLASWGRPPAVLVFRGGAFLLPRASPAQVVSFILSRFFFRPQDVCRYPPRNAVGPPVVHTLTHRRPGPPCPRSRSVVKYRDEHPRARRSYLPVVRRHRV
jgi:hypothetical protein